MAKRRRYSDSDKAAALTVLDANEGNRNETAKHLDSPRTTLERWVEGRVSGDVPQLRQQTKKALANELEALAYKLIEAMPERLEGANLQQASVALGIVVEKMQLLRGDPTERFEHTLDDRERASRITAILDRGRERRTGSTDSEYIQ